MKTDEELGERLRQASRTVLVPEDPVERLYLRRATKRRRERLTAAVVAMVLFVAAVGGTLFALRGVWDKHRGIPGSGEWTPDRPLELQPGQYFYLKGTDFGFDGSRQDQQTWWAPDGSGELRFDTNRPDKYEPMRQEGVYGKGQFPEIFGTDLSALSTDPKVLEEQLRERSAQNTFEFAPDGPGPVTSGRLWGAIRRLLDFEWSPNAPPELRAALFEVAAGLDGVTRQDGAQDPVGREALVLKLDELVPGVNDQGERTEYTMRWELFFDPGTHQMMAEAVGFDALPVPFEILESAIVDARGAEPTDDQLLFPKPVHEFVPPPQPSPSLP
ncbi:MAG TPA: hypothetical protein VF986_01640 [Actinomycetota bacterium]